MLTIVENNKIFLFFMKVILKTSVLQVLGQVRKPSSTRLFFISVASIEVFPSSLPCLMPRGTLFNDHLKSCHLARHLIWINVRPQFSDE